MLAKINSAALYGIDALRVEVEIDLASGLPQLATVGLAEGAVRESKDRIRAALMFRSRTAGMHHYCYTVADYDPATVVRTLERAGLKPRREGNRVYFPDPDGLTVQLSARNDWNDW